MMPWPFPDEGPRSDRHQRPPDPDTTLRQEVTDRFRQHPDAGMRAITVQAQHGVVLLDGTVACPAVRDSAAHIAREISGVRDVCNMVTVSAAPGGTPSTAQAGTTGHRHQFAQPDRTAFDDIAADLLAQDPSLARPVKTSPNLAVRITLAVVAGIAWALLSVLLVTATWLAVLIIGGISIVATAVALGKRKPHRSGGTPRRILAGGGS